MTQRMKCWMFQHLIFGFLALIPLSAFGGQGLCERLLADGTLRAAVYEIDILGNDEPGVGNVIVIRNGNDSGEGWDPARPEMDIGDVETGNNRLNRERPEFDLPYPEPALQEIVPEPRKEIDKLPAILPLVDPKEIPNIGPVKKPPKPLPN